MLIGFLIMHGFIYGYNETTNTLDLIRAKRIFCSNRNNKKGCGKTFSIFKSFIIKSFTFTANTVWSFLNNIINRLNIAQAFNILNIPAGKSSPYRLFKKLKNKQSEIRSKLYELFKPPPCSIYDKPIFQTIEHLKNAFIEHDCPISAFQYKTQTSIF